MLALAAWLARGCLACIEPAAELRLHLNLWSEGHFIGRLQGHLFQTLTSKQRLLGMNSNRAERVRLQVP